MLAWLVWLAVAVMACDEDRGPGGIEHDDHPINDAQIAQALLSVSTGEIQIAEIAGPKAETPQVKAFAAAVVKEQTQARQAIEHTMMTRSIGRDRGKPSDEIDSAMTNLLDKLHVRTGADLEWAYISEQIEVHQHVMRLIETELLTNVVDAGLHARVIAMRDMLRRHLDEAQRIKAVLGSVARESP